MRITIEDVKVGDLVFEDDGYGDVLRVLKAAYWDKGLRCIEVQDMKTGEVGTLGCLDSYSAYSPDLILMERNGQKIIGLEL